MVRLIAKILVTAFGLWIADVLLEGVTVESVTTLWLSAFVLGVVNTLIRPLVVLLTLPITFLTFGIFLFVINGAMLLLVARIVPSFHVDSLWAAIIAWLIITVVNWMVPAGKKKTEKTEGG